MAGRRQLFVFVGPDEIKDGVAAAADSRRWSRFLHHDKKMTEHHELLGEVALPHGKRGAGFVAYVAERTPPSGPSTSSRRS